MGRINSHRHTSTPVALFGATLTAVCALSFGAIPGVALAQDASAESTEIEEIIVTATRREEALFDVAKSVTAMTGDTLDSFGMDSFSDYAGLVPSLDFVEFSPSQTRITIRGVSADPSFTTPSTISTYVNDTPTTSSNAGNQIDMRLYDVERVEIMRGPQGTLFGENSMGGAIRIVTAKPDSTQSSGSAQFGIGTIDGGAETFRGDAMVNVPIVANKMAFRAVGSWRKSGGWIDNTSTGEQNANSNEVLSGRAALRFTPNENLTVDLTAMLNRIDVDSTNETTISNTQIDADANSPTTDDYDIFSAEIDWNLGAFSVQSITSYTQRDAVFGLSEASVSVDSQNFLFVLGCVTADPASFDPFTFSCSVPDPDHQIQTSIYSRSMDEDVWTQELRIVSPDDQRFRWILGGFYRDGETQGGTFRATNPEVTFANTFYVPFGFAEDDVVPGGFLADNGSTSTTNHALFGEASFDITDDLTITAGGRWFKEKFAYDTTASGLLIFFGTFMFESPAVQFESKAKDFISKVVLSYQPSDKTHLFASFSEGFRSGGANFFSSAATNFVPQFEPDSTQNFEVGGKFRLWDGRVDLSATGYYIKWKNMQINDFDLLTGQGFIRNGGEAHTMGLEWELAARVSERFTVTLSGNMNEAETDQDTPGSFNPIIPEGTRLPNVPKMKYGIMAEYIHPIPSWDAMGIVRVDVRGQGHTFSALERRPKFFGTFPLSPNESRQGAYAIGNIRAGLESEGWSAFLYIQNVWNEVADYGDNNFGRFHRNQPRTIGVTVSGNF